MLELELVLLGTVAVRGECHLFLSLSSLDEVDDEEVDVGIWLTPTFGGEVGCCICCSSLAYGNIVGVVTLGVTTVEVAMVAPHVCGSVPITRSLGMVIGTGISGSAVIGISSDFGDSSANVSNITISLASSGS